MTRNTFLGHVLALCLATPLAANPMLIADLSDPAQAGQWRFFTDQVMGGVSQGRADISDGALRLTGEVSTANNGGFIQARMSPVSPPPEASQITLRVKGDGQTYYIHLRTSGTRLPWQYYQAAFTAGPDWQDITLPLSTFSPSGSLLRKTPRAKDIRSIALVAYGRDHKAEVSLSRLTAE
ncbi:MAG: CIA30 family protein [Paracoccaceae bacterium]|nr:CIA30 family protein [Paracoccaceae bacterium]